MKTDNIKLQNTNSDNNKEKKVEIIIKKDLCKGCELCVTVCKKGNLQMSSDLNSKGFHYSELKDDNCSGCGNCFYICPEPDAITIIKKK